MVTVARTGRNMKDLKGAIFWIGVIVAICLLFISVGCTVAPAYRPVIKFGALRELDRKFGDSGWVGHVTISQPIHYFGPAPPSSCLAPPSLEGLYLHGSDLLTQDDYVTVDALGPVFTVPLGRIKK